MYRARLSGLTAKNNGRISMLVMVIKEKPALGGVLSSMLNVWTSPVKKLVLGSA